MGGETVSATQRIDQRTGDSRVLFLAKQGTKNSRNRSLAAHEGIQKCKGPTGDRRRIDLQLRRDRSVSIAKCSVWQINLRKDQDEGEQKKLEGEHCPAPACHGRRQKPVATLLYSGTGVNMSSAVPRGQKGISDDAIRRLYRDTICCTQAQNLTLNNFNALSFGHTKRSRLVIRMCATSPARVTRVTATTRAGSFNNAWAGVHLACPRAPQAHRGKTTHGRQA
jgi:hypothetical protein